MLRRRLTYEPGHKIPVSINLYLPPELDRRIREMAESEKISINKLATRLIISGLDKSGSGPLADELKELRRRIEALEDSRKDNLQ